MAAGAHQASSEVRSSPAIAAALDGTQLSFNLEGDTLNLDHYLPGPETAQQASRGLLRKAFAQTSGTLLPQAWLSTLTLQGDLSVDQLLLAGLTFDDTQLALRGENGNHRLTAFESRFYEGELSATGQLDATGDVLEWQLSPSISNVQVAPLIETFSEEEAPLARLENARMRLLEAEGQHLDALECVPPGTPD